MVGKTGYCVFHNLSGKDCALYKLVETQNLPKRLIPPICRIFPFSWDNGPIFVCGETQKLKKAIPEKCNCLDKFNKTLQNLSEAQINEIKDIFEIDFGNI